MMTALTIIHVVISLALIVVVLMQHGKQQGLSGAIAGGAETFFGKNKGRTVDAILKKFTAVVAVLFIVSSVTFAAMAVNVYNKNNEVSAPEASTETGDQSTAATVDENGNLVDAEGNVIMSAEDMAAAAENAEAEAPAEDAEAPAENAEAEATAEAEAAPAE